VCSAELHRQNIRPPPTKHPTWSSISTLSFCPVHLLCSSALLSIFLPFSVQSTCFSRFTLSPSNHASVFATFFSKLLARSSSTFFRVQSLSNPLSSSISSSGLSPIFACNARSLSQPVSNARSSLVVRRSLRSFVVVGFCPCFLFLGSFIYQLDCTINST
jgi:hypothetical protein